MQPVAEPFEPYLLDSTEESRMVLCDDCHVAVRDGRHGLNALRYLHQYTDMALQAMSDQIRVGYISRQDEKLLSVRKNIMLSGHNKSLFEMLRRDTRLVDLFHWSINYAVPLELVYDVQLLQAQNATLPAKFTRPGLSRTPNLHVLSLIPRRKTLLQKQQRVQIFTEQSKRSNCGHDLGLVCLYDDSIFSCKEDDGRLLVMTTDGRINNSALSSSVQAQSFYNFGKKELCAYCNLRDHVTRWKAKDGVEPASFDKFLIFTLDNAVTRVP